jgi:putative SOS response-associated peptidase YedK
MYKEDPMCYRYSIHSKPELIEARFNSKFTQNFIPQYHVSAFSQQKLPVITNDNSQQIQLFNWGLIPFWVKDQKQAGEIQQKTANARAETIYEKPAFRHAAQKKHCLALVDGFFEWREFQGRKYPYYIRLKSHEPFSIAGLWEIWVNKETDERTYSYTIITTKANPLMEKIHNIKKRMPAILPKELERLWIKDSISSDKAKELLVPISEFDMEAYTISRLITSKTQDPNVPGVIHPYAYPELKDSIDG